jgi:hypothetical protein
LDIQGDWRIFHHTGTVSDRYTGVLPYWHRKAGFLPLHRLLTELASSSTMSDSLATASSGRFSAFSSSMNCEQIL